jgi:2-iminobutanoate/2-iminopropanoate deaminase
LIKEVINIKGAPQAIGTYSQGIKTENFIFTSGQIPINPQTGNLKTDDIKAEIRQVLDNLNAVLEGGGSALQSTVKLTVFVTDLGYFSEVNEVFNEYFPENPPARSAVQVSALPMGARIEIEAIGVVE